VEEFSKKAGAIQMDLMKDIKTDQGLLNLLEQAKKQGIKCAIGTSSLRWRAEEMLDLLKIKNFFEVIVTADDVDNSSSYLVCSTCFSGQCV